MTRVIVLLLLIFSLLNLAELPDVMVEGATVEALGGSRGGGGSSSRGGGGGGGSHGGGGSSGRGVPFPVGAGAGAAGGAAAAGAGNAGTFPPRARPSNNSAAPITHCTVAGTSFVVVDANKDLKEKKYEDLMEDGYLISDQPEYFEDRFKDSNPPAKSPITSQNNSVALTSIIIVSTALVLMSS